MAYDEKQIMQQLSDPKTRRQAFTIVVRQYSEPLYWKIRRIVYRIAINESLDFVRKQKTASCVSSDEDLSVANKLMADDYFDGDETQAQLQEAISQLPDVQRVVFNLRYYDEMKYSEISKLLGTSEGALKASYHLAVKKITEFFKNRD